MLRVVTAPARSGTALDQTLFLAGSIANGLACHWQQDVVNRLQNMAVTNLTVFNPRRADWDATWEPGCPNMIAQIDWELEHLLMADDVVFYFDPATQAPVTMLELGLIAGQCPRKAWVCCPQGFWRKDNVDRVCQRFQVPCFDSLDRWLAEFVSSRCHG